MSQSVLLPDNHWCKVVLCFDQVKCKLTNSFSGEKLFCLKVPCLKLARNYEAVGQCDPCFWCYMLSQDVVLLVHVMVNVLWYDWCALEDMCENFSLSLFLDSVVAFKLMQNSQGLWQNSVVVLNPFLVICNAQILYFFQSTSVTNHFLWTAVHIFHLMKLVLFVFGHW